ncbi:hypothetical protein GGI35DRAFT_202808 [Trichoderma velutinum]
MQAHDPVWAGPIAYVDTSVCLRCNDVLGNIVKMRYHYQNIHEVKRNKVDDEIQKDWDKKWRGHGNVKSQIWHELLRQTFSYARSFSVLSPNARLSAKLPSLLREVLSSGPPPVDPINRALVGAVVIFLSGEEPYMLDFFTRQFFKLFDWYISRTTTRWQMEGFYAGISIISCLVNSGNGSNPLKNAILHKRADDVDIVGGHTSSIATSANDFETSLDFAVRANDIVLRRLDDENVLPFLLTQMMLVDFLSRLSESSATKQVGNKWPWELLAKFLNHHRNNGFSARSIIVYYGLPEDEATSGLFFAEKRQASLNFPASIFFKENDKQYKQPIQDPFTRIERIERILSLGRRIAESCHVKWLNYNEEEGFKVKSTRVDNWNR